MKEKFSKYFWSKVNQKLFRLKSLTMKELDFLESDKILVLAPHPDDESIGCGGLLLKYSKITDVICLTDGRYGGKGENFTETIQERRAEFVSSMEYAQVSRYSFLDIEDQNLINSAEAFSQIDFTGYRYIFIPNFLDTHIDHQAVSKLLLGSKLQSDVSIVMYEVWNGLALPNSYIDISDVIEKKEKLIKFYTSQLEGMDFHKRILGLNYYRGMAIARDYVEAYSQFDLKSFRKLVQ
jgi:LmbE family N-acetylglucosaminyl deacetylase